MKRVKFMLAAIIILATIGGALAFKAKQPLPPYCIKGTIGGGSICTSALSPGNTVNVGFQIYYTTTNNRALCIGAPGCTRLGAPEFE